MNAPAQTCCYRAALDPDAAYCGECGEPLLRCMAFDECAGLLNKRGCCPVCVTLEVHLDTAAMGAAQIGGVLSLPLTLANRSTVGRALFVCEIMVKRAGSEYTRVALSWEKLEPGISARIGVPTGVLEEAGVHQFDFLIIVASRYRWREERYAFETSVTADVSAARAAPVVNQTIRIDGDMAPGFTFYNPTRVDASQPEKWDDASGPMPLDLRRAEKFERDSGLRGLDGEISVARATRLVWLGFAEDEAPAEGPILGRFAALNIGRSRSRQANGPNDVRLLVRGSDGTIDAQGSSRISRHHFDLYIENDRLILRIESPNGLRVNGEAYGRGKTVALRHGDSISPLVKQPKALELVVTIDAHFGNADSITITRQSGKGA